MSVGLHIDMVVAPGGQTTTQFHADGIALAEVGPLVDKAIAALQHERAEMPADHGPQPPLSDLGCIEYAVQKVLAECRKANPHHMLIPPDGTTVMRWLAAALTEAKGLRKP